MKQRVFVIHGWEGYPDEGWRPWLRTKLEEKGYEVHVPAMPDTKHPTQDAWVKHLQDEVGVADEQCYLIGHSLGCMAIIRYLETLREGSAIGGVIFVAGFDDDLGVTELSDFFITPIDWTKIKKLAKTFVSIESDNDPYGLAKYNDVFAEKLGAKIILEHNKKHFSGDDGISELPVVYDELMSISS